MADLGFNRRVKLSEGFLIAGNLKIGVVTKAIFPTGLRCDKATACAAHDINNSIFINKRGVALVTRLPVFHWDTAQFPQ